MLKRYMATYKSNFLDTCIADIDEDEDGDLVLYGDAAALEAENAALREKLAAAETKPNLVGYDLKKDREFKDGFDRLAASSIDKKTRRIIVKEVMAAIHAHAEASYQRGLAAAEARTVPDLSQLTGYEESCMEGGGVCEEKGGTFVKRAEVQALLSASAAPAAQEDAKT